MSYRFSNSDVNKILEAKEKFSRGPRNFAVHKAKLQRDLINAQNSGDQDLVTDIENKLVSHTDQSQQRIVTNHVSG